MKINKTICLICLICALLAVSTASAKELPTEEKLNSFIDTIPKENGFVSTAFEKSVEENPSWPCDKWSDGSVSFYYEASGLKGYSSIYYNDNGIETTPARGSINTKSHTGDEVIEDTKTESNSTSNASVNDCPTCPKATAQADTPRTENVAVSDSSLTEEQQKQLEEFMEYFDGKESVTVDGIKEQAIECFFTGGQ
jgi:hypothetical protein